jgi:drug/metabolite transporter (DMT)-like permease
VATSASMNPIVAVGVGALLLGERVDATMAAGGALILGSVALVVAQSVPRQVSSANRP